MDSIRSDDSSHTCSFSFGMNDFDEFDSDSDNDANKVIVEMDCDNLGCSNDIIEEMACLTIHADNDEFVQVGDDVIQNLESQYNSSNELMDACQSELKWLNPL